MKWTEICGEATHLNKQNSFTGNKSMRCDKQVDEDSIFSMAVSYEPTPNGQSSQTGQP